MADVVANDMADVLAIAECLWQMLLPLLLQLVAICLF